MQLVEGLDNINQPFPAAVVTIGNFDGVHKGHQALFKEVKSRAREIDGTSVVITFEPHPARVLNDEAMLPLITMYEQKMELIAAAGIDVCVCIPFTRAFAAVSAADFLKNELVARIGMQTIVIGKDYAFGKNRAGDIDFLRQRATRLGFKVVCLHEVAVVGKTRVSSTIIRETVQNGDMAMAAKLLGRYYQIRGEVVTGRGRGGKLLGFPTANIELADELCPLSGVYAVTVGYDSGWYQGVANIGYSPTFDDHLFTVEVYILDFNKNINGNRLKVNFIERIRAEKRFSGIDELKAQIAKDVDAARKLLSEVKGIA